MKKCSLNSKITSMLVFKFSDVKPITKENGLVMKRKYGKKFPRTVFRFNLK